MPRLLRWRRVQGNAVGTVGKGHGRLVVEGAGGVVVHGVFRGWGQKADFIPPGGGFMRQSVIKRFIVARGQIPKSEVLSLKGKFDGADGAVALFSNVDIGDAPFRRVRVIDFAAVDEEDDVGMLLYRPRSRKIREQRAFVCPLFGAL